MSVSLIVVLECLAQSASAMAVCVGLARTGDGFDKEAAVSCAHLALDEYIQQYNAGHGLDTVTVSAMRAEPQPHWRGSVSYNRMRCPDIITDGCCTVCWQDMA